MVRKCILAAAAVAFALCVRAAEFAIDCAAAAVDAPPSLAVGDSIAVRLAGGGSYALRLVAAPPAGIAGQSYIARDEVGGASAVVKPTADGIRVSIDDFANHRLVMVVVRDGKASSTAVDTAPPGHDECGTCGGEIASSSEAAASKSALKPVRALSAGDFEVAEHKSVVDILVAFDQGAVAKSAALGYASMEDFADYAVGKMNMVLANSRLDDKFCYRLAGVAAIDGAWTAVNSSLLAKLRTREGAFAKIARLREKCGADTITLLIDRTEGTTSGIGHTYSSDFGVPTNFDNKNYACNVCDINTVHSRYTMSHETGHNMGCGHSNRQGSNSGPGRYPDACGYHFVDAGNVRRSTVMAYTYASGDSYYYDPVPYFSAPDITPPEYGCALGVEGTNNNCRTLSLTHADIASLREHVAPYDWDVRFLDDSGNDIPDGAYFPSYYYVTITHSNPNATIYYTYDVSTPTKTSAWCSPGTRFPMSGARTITACAVVGGVAESVRTMHFAYGLNWSGDSVGSGLWRSGDSSLRPWSGEYFYTGDPVRFPDLAGVSSATVTVKGAVSPGSVSFTACDTHYTFACGDDGAQIAIPDAGFAPAGDVTFDVPVQLGATTFTNMTGCVLTFNAPFGQTVGPTGGYCTNMINIGPAGTLTVAPGPGKTQTLSKLNNIGWYASNSTFRVGKGIVVFKGAINGGAGVVGRTTLKVGDGGELVFDMGGGTGYQMNQTSLTVEKGGKVTFNEMEHMRRTLFLDGGTIRCRGRLDLMNNPGVYVTDSSSVEDIYGGYILIRDSDASIDVAAGKTLTLGLGTRTDGRSDTAGHGMVKRGGGTLAANVELRHSGVTDVKEGVFAVGYSSGGTYGLGWAVADGATLRIASGCSLSVPSLALAGGATLEVPAASSAPVSAAGQVDLSGVRLALCGVVDLAEGRSYPILAAGGFAGVSDAESSGLPELPAGLKWHVEESGGTLFVRIVPTGERPPSVDILVGFDNGARSYVAGRGVTMEEFASAQIAKMNDALATNRLDRHYTYRLAGVCRVDAAYERIGDVSGGLVAGVGPLVALRSARELCGADTVTLLVDNASDATLGYGCPLSSSTDVAGCHDDAFSVCSIRAVDTGRQHTMLHENAHNMGCGHSRVQAQANSPFEYGRGVYFRDGDVTRHTIMAYGGDNDASWYFSTSSGEFGFALGDASNDNARVLRETCGAVSRWRGEVRPRAGDVLAHDADGREVLSGRAFASSITVSLSAAEGARILYTLDGSAPTASSSVYSSPLVFTSGATLNVAALSGGVVSPAREIRLFRIFGLPSGAMWSTGAKYPWSAEGGSVRSWNHTDYRHFCTTPLSAAVTGPKRLSFSHRSYFMPERLSSNYSHFDVLLDGSPVLAQTDFTNEWRQAFVDIPIGEHEVSFVYSQRCAMNNPSDYKDGAPEADDAVWLKDLSLADVEAFVVPGTSVSFVPDLDAVSEMGGYIEGETDLQEFLEETGWNGQPRWVSYVLGIDADFDTGVQSDIRVEGGKVVITPAKGARKIPGLVIESRLYGSSELSGSMPFIKAARGATIEVAPFESSAKGFYRLEVSVGAQ